MEHFVQFSINFDDKTIQKRLEEYAYYEILEKIYDKVKPKVDSMLNTSRYSDNPVTDMINVCVERAINEDKDQIIEEVIKRIESKVYRSNMMKEEIFKMKERNK